MKYRKPKTLYLLLLTFLLAVAAIDHSIKSDRVIQITVSGTQNPTSPLTKNQPPR